jgi:TPR repeat protein
MRILARVMCVTLLVWCSAVPLPAQQSEADRKLLDDVRAKAEKGDAEAQVILGLCYENGRGVAKYEVEAYKWDLLAAAQGDTKAKRNASLLELMLLPEQIAEGKRRAQDWLEQHRKASAEER